MHGQIHHHVATRARSCPIAVAAVWVISLLGCGPSEMGHTGQHVEALGHRSGIVGGAGGGQAGPSESAGFPRVAGVVADDRHPPERLRLDRSGRGHPAQSDGFLIPPFGEHRPTRAIEVDRLGEDGLGPR